MTLATLLAWRRGLAAWKYDTSNNSAGPHLGIAQRIPDGEYDGGLLAVADDSTGHFATFGGSEALLPSRLRRGRSPDRFVFVEPLGAEPGIVTEVEVDVLRVPKTCATWPDAPLVVGCSAPRGLRGRGMIFGLWG